MWLSLLEREPLGRGSALGAGALDRKGNLSWRVAGSMAADSDIRAPIQRRLEKLREQWKAFAEDSEARLMHWVVAPGDWKLLEAFFAVEDHESGTLPDLFLTLTPPFKAPASYGFELIAALSSMHEEIRADLTEAGASSSWRVPQQPSGRDDTQALFDVAASFHAHHQPLFRHLALVLLPERVSSPRAWARWVERAVRSAVPEGVRLVCFDAPDAVALAGVATTQPQRVRTHVAALDLNAALEEISTAAGGLDTPAGRYRQLFVQLGRAIEQRDLPRAEHLAAEAAALSQQQGWGHLLVAAHFALGSGYLSAGDALAALRAYRQAEIAAEHSRAEPYGLALLLKVRMALGTALLMADAPARAATMYEEAALLAEQAGDLLLRLECWRMAAYCHERARAYEASWGCGLKALAVARNMDEQSRRTSTLSYLGEGMLRLTRRRKYRNHGRAIEQQLTQLLGAAWRPASPGSAPS
jgi:tetratricopeptide (TPR) repeat protein